MQELFDKLIQMLIRYGLSEKDAKKLVAQEIIQTLKIEGMMIE